MGDGPSALEARLFLNGAAAGSTLLNRVDHWFWGFAMPVLVGDGVSYEVSAQGGGAIPQDWVIAFSDPIFGNKWAVDELELTVAGRSCGRIDSMHDRRFIFASPAASLGDDRRARGRRSWSPGRRAVRAATSTVRPTTASSRRRRAAAFSRCRRTSGKTAARAPAVEP